jgi:hypothetical protein
MNVEEQLRRAAVDVDALPSAPTVAWTDIVRRADTLGRRRTRRRVGVVAVALALVSVIAVAGVVRGGGTHRVVTGGPTSPSDQTGWRVFDTGPLTPRSDEVEVWTGHELILWGGSTGGRSRALADGAAFNPQTGTWRRLPASPLAARQDAIGVWTGTRLLVVGGKNDNTALPNGASYDPTSRTWKQIAPIPNGTAAAVDPRLAIWTGQRLLLPNVGLAYNPTNNQWSSIAQPPANQITFQTSIWTGHDVIMIGIGAAVPTAGPTPVVALAYDPTTNEWRSLPSSGMDTAAVAAAWDGTRVVVVSYDMKAATYQPITNTWQPLPAIPLRFYECYPSAFTIAGHAYAQMCSGFAALDNHNRWTPIAYPSPLSGPGHVVPTDNAALVWGSAFPTSDSRYTPSPVAEYTPSDDEHREVLVGLAITTLPDGYKTTKVDAATTSATGTMNAAHVEGPHGACTITSTTNSVENGAAAELNRLDQLAGATRRQPPPAQFPGGPDFAVEVPPTAHDPQRHLAWALTSTDTINIGCEQLSLVNQLAAATHVDQQG